MNLPTHLPPPREQWNFSPFIRKSETIPQQVHFPISDPFTQISHYFPKTVSDAISEIVKETKAPDLLVSSSALAAMALAVQGKYRIIRNDRIESPCSLAIIIICDSGERKSTVDGIVMKPFLAFEESVRSEQEKEERKYQNSLEIWETQRRVFKSMLRKAVKNGDSTEEWEKNLENHLDKKPTPPRKIRMLYSDATPEAFLSGLHDCRSVCIHEDEASRFFSTPLASDIGLLNKAWNGTGIQVDRKTAGTFFVREPRVTLSLMTQPSAFDAYIKKNGKEVIDLGFMSRLLICQPTSTQGSRLSNSLDYISTTSRDSFASRITQLLEQQKEEGSLFNAQSEVQLRFSYSAQILWNQLADTIEYCMRPGYVFCDIKGYASKIAENIARIAGIFHVFQDQPPNNLYITENTLIAAIYVANRYIHEFFNIAHSFSIINNPARDAEILMNWAIKKGLQENNYNFEKNYIRQHVTNQLRDKERLDNALAVLYQTGRAVATVSNKKTIISFTPSFINAPMPYSAIFPRNN